MKTKQGKTEATGALLGEIAKLLPVAKGSLTATHSPCTRKNCRACQSGGGHPKLIFTFRENGKLRGLYVRPQHERIVRKAIENGRELERLITRAGEDLVRSLRLEADS